MHYIKTIYLLICDLKTPTIEGQRKVIVCIYLHISNATPEVSKENVVKLTCQGQIMMHENLNQIRDDIYSK